MSSSSASLPRHYYVWVDSAFIREGGAGFEPAVWFGLHSHPGRAWGCHVMLECGAFYRGLPPHAIAFKVGETGEYLFTAVPQGDAYTHDPSQGKEFMFIRTDRDRLVIVPTNNLLFEERSFTVDQGWPCLKRSTETWSCE